MFRHKKVLSTKYTYAGNKDQTCDVKRNVSRFILKCAAHGSMCKGNRSR